ncbi:MAG: helix-turn-helix domain-containing protein [Xanthobacteraceae bacterium]|nr:helix-turn-helix domain-containing protein [Xanthobacteraceae bacterium]
MTLATIDLALRSGAVALLALLAVLVLRDFSRRPAGWLAAAFAAGSAVYAVSSAAGFAALPLVWRAPLTALSTGNIVVFWLFTRALFEDDYAPRRWQGAVYLAVVALSLLNCVVIAPADGARGNWLGLALSLAALGFIALAVGQSLQSWSADLVEGRRLLRLFIVGAAAVDGGVNSLLQLALGAGGPSAAGSAVNAAVLLGIAAVIVAAMTRAAGDEVFAPAAEAEAETRAPDTAAPGDTREIIALNRLMRAERIYRQEGVTIGVLAGRLGMPEYRLRRLINQKLGYRNFSVFLNSYRLEEVKAALADPTQAAVPVTTIALDAGFQSIGPFNRAFKSDTGVTPTEFRRARLPAG